MLGLIHRCLLGRGPPQFNEFIRRADADPERHTRQSVRRHRFQVRSIVDGHQKELAKRSLLGMLDIYNMLPAAIVERSASVKEFQQALQNMVCDRTQASDSAWEHLYSSRLPRHAHPLLQFVGWKPA